MTIDYQKQLWKDGTDDYTPPVSARFNHMEEGIKAACDAWDSVAHGVGTVNPGWTIGHFDLYRHGRIVTCSMEIAYLTLATLGGVYARVPEGFRPVSPLYNAPIALADGANCCVGLASISADGYVSLNSNGVRVNQVLASLTWVA